MTRWHFSWMHHTDDRSPMTSPVTLRKRKNQSLNQDSQASLSYGRGKNQSRAFPCWCSGNERMTLAIQLVVSFLRGPKTVHSVVPFSHQVSDLCIKLLVPFETRALERAVSQDNVASERSIYSLLIMRTQRSCLKARRKLPELLRLRLRDMVVFYDWVCLCVLWIPPKWLFSFLLSL